MISGEPSRTPLRRLTPSHYVEFSRLGEGSMGLVYLALDTELNRRVAFKMIRPLEEEEGAEPLEATPSPEDETFGELKARFLQEAWVTGGLEHPGIVPVYELGETTGGIPYYTMRVVRGERTLTDAIEQAQGLDGRLALLEPFLKVCDTVRYAHARGVIHRDLKPSNIALGDYGEAVVLDWGLAKLKDRPDLARSVWQKRIEELRDETDLHTLASAIGTPGYMSPEAALVEIDKVDARSDVYSLGAILYRILTGKLPYEFQSYPELVQKLTGEVPRDPSEVDAAVPASLSRICLKALSAKREERYADADEVAAAIRAWQRESALEREVASLLREAESALETAPSLGGEALLRQVDRVTSVCARILDLRPGDARAPALQARGHELRERAIGEREQRARRRLLKRVAIVGLATATAATVIVALLLDAKRREAEEARTRETQARTRAEQERLRAEDLAQFMLFDLRSGLEPIGRLDLLAKVAQKSLQYYDTLPVSDTDTGVLRRRSIALEGVGNVLREQGDLTAALDAFRSVVEMGQRLVMEAPHLADSHLMLARGHMCTALALQAQGENESAVATFQEALIILNNLLEKHPAQTEVLTKIHECHTFVGMGRFDQRQVEDALHSHEAALAAIRRLVELEPEDTESLLALARTHNNIAVAQHSLGDLDSAQEHFEESLRITRQAGRREPEHAECQSVVAHTLVNLGELEGDRGSWARARQSVSEATVIQRRLAKNDHTNAVRWADLSRGLAMLGDICARGQSDWREAATAYGQALEVDRRLCRMDPTNSGWHHRLCQTLCRVGDSQEAMGDLRGAEASYAEAGAVAREGMERFSRTSRLVRIALIGHGKRGAVLEQRGDVKAAARAYQEALTLAKEVVASHPESAMAQQSLYVTLERIGRLLEAQTDWEAALGRHQESLAIRKALAERQPSNLVWQRHVAIGYQHVGDVQLKLKRLQEALESHRDALRVSRRLAARNPSNAIWQRDVSTSLLKVGRVLAAQGELKESARVLREACELHRSLAAKAPQFADEHSIWESRYAKASLLAGERPVESATDHLLLARALYEREEYPASAGHYATALEDESIRSRGGSLYNGACAAALASAALEGEEAVRWGARALEWLGEDLRRRREIVAQIDKDLAGDVEAERRARLEKQRQSLIAHFEHARVKDPDLASLRGTPEFEALFEETDGER